MNLSWPIIETPKLVKIELKNLALNNPKRPLRILDVGGGQGLVWMEIDQSGWLMANGIELEVTILDASDLGKSADSKSLRVRWEDGRAPACLESKSAGSFDLVCALDVIEHLPKHEGYHLLYQMHRISSHNIVRAPNGFVWQPPFVSNPFQAHVSSWTASELRRMGFRRQFGEAGPKFLVGIGTVPKFMLSKNNFRKSFSLIERAVIAVFKIGLFWVPAWSAEVVSIRRTRNFDLEIYMQIAN